MPSDTGLEWVTPNLLNHLLIKAERNQSRTLMVNNAKRWRRWYRGDTFLAPVREFDDMSVAEENATARRNIIGETLDEVSSIFLKNTPIIRRIPYRPEWARLADDIDAMWLWQWGESYAKNVMRSLLEESEIGGLGVLKVYWDPFKGNRHVEGGVGIKFVPTSVVYVDPDATNDHRGSDAAYIFEKSMRYPEEIIARFGEEGRIALGWNKRDTGPRAAQSTLAHQMLGMSREEVTKRVDGRNELLRAGNTHSGAQGQDDKKKIPVYQCWLFPDKLWGNDISGSEDVSEDYRFGVLAYMVNNHVVHKRINPNARKARIPIDNADGTTSRVSRFIGHGKHPYVFLHWRRISDKAGNRKFYDTMSMVEWMVSCQFNVNALRRNLAIILRTIANPVILYNEDALGTPVNKLTWTPGQMIKVRGQTMSVNDALRILQPSQMPMQVVQMIMDDIQAIKRAGGVQPGVSGLFPAPGGGTSHTPAETIGSLQESAFGTLWKYVEQVGDAFEDAAVLYEGLMQQFFKADHYVASSRHGAPTQVEWTGEHRIAQFRRIVVAGATTPIYDLQREEREAKIKAEVDAAISTQDPRVIRTTLIYLGHINFPWAADYLEILQEELQRLEQIQQAQQEIGAFQVLGGGSAPGLPAGQAPGMQQGGGVAPEEIEQLAESMGVTPEQLMMAAATKQ